MEALAVIFLLQVFLTNDFLSNRSERSVLNEGHEVAKSSPQNMCLGAPSIVVGLPSAPLRCITYISLSDVDKADFVSENHFWDSVFGFLSVYRPDFPRSFSYVLILSILPDTADST